MKLVLNRAGNAIIAFVVRSKYGDFTNGFKCYRRQVIDAMEPLIAEHFNLTVEMSISALLGGTRYAVIPNLWWGRDKGSSKFRLVSESRLYVMTIAYCWLRARLRGKTWASFQDALAKSSRRAGHDGRTEAASG